MSPCVGDSGAFQCALRGARNILNSSEAMEITKKKTKKQGGSAGSKTKECIQYGSLPLDGLDKIYLHSSAITSELPLHLPFSRRPSQQPPPPVSALPVVNKQSDTVLTVETLGSRLRDTGGRLWRNITPTDRFLFRPGKQQTFHSGVALSVTSAN